MKRLTFGRSKRKVAIGPAQNPPKNSDNIQMVSVGTESRKNVTEERNCYPRVTKMISILILPKMKKKIARRT